MDSKNVLQVEDLQKKFHGFEIKNVNFSLEAGYIMGFVGRNGAGKTTIMKLIQNVIVKQSGRVTICGYDNRKQEIKAKNQIGFVADNSPFIKNYTLKENAELFGQYYKDFDMNRFAAFLKRFDLDGKKTISALSKGMGSKFQLAFALAHNPRLLIMDEPTDGLDPIFRREFLSLLQELIQEEQMGILFSTHITSDLDKVADYITFVEGGEVILSQDRETVMDRYRILKGDLNLLQRIPEDKFIAIRRNREGFEGMTENIKEIKPFIRDSDNILIQRAVLDDVIFYYSKRSKSYESAEIV